MAWIHPVPPISNAERQERLGRLRQAMQSAGVGGLLLGSTESLNYFTGLVWHPSERLVGALVTESGLTYICPGFERSRLETLPCLEGEIAIWDEEDSSAALVGTLLGPGAILALDDELPLFVHSKLSAAIGIDRLRDGGRLIRDLRCLKSKAEIDLIRHAMGLTLEVHKRAHGILKPGIRASEVVRFIDEQHRALGADGGSTFCIVSFGQATSLPHGAEGDQVLGADDVILIDTGCRLDGYHSDLTRTYKLAPGDAEFAAAWEIERAAQQAVFEAARLGAACSTLDDAARALLSTHGLGPDYRLPGLPHRAGHGLGLQIHEEPYIVRGNDRPLAAGMCFSNEPMIVFPGRYGIRLEDHIYMADDGPVFFTQPQASPFEPFGKTMTSGKS